MNRLKIEQIVEKYKLPKYKFKQIADAAFKKYLPSFEEITTLSKAERDLISKNEDFLTIEPFKILVSTEKNAYKALLKLKSSGRLIESVLLNPKPGLWSTCISSQVGCAMDCSFCATGKMGFLQNLTAEEIFDQVLFWKQYIVKNKITDTHTQSPASLSNVVFMGMGEPLANLKEVFSAIRELTSAETLNLASRNISVSTSGLIPGINLITKEFPQINLAISLHAADDELRSKLMPVNKSFPLKKLTESLEGYIEKTNRKLFVEYILLDGENDNDKDAKNLANWVKNFKKRHLIHVNLIVYNKTNSGHEESKKAARFKQIIANKGIHATIRKNLGRDIMAACGQLVTEQS